MEKTVELTQDTFNKIQKIIYKKIGVNLNSSKKTMVKSRLLKRLRVLNFSSFEEYLEFLNYNSDELVILYNFLTTNVTHFFREKHHFEYMKEKVLPEILMADKKIIRVWSAGCSSGEEVYSLAITLKEFFPKSWTIKILGTDINTEVLKIAKVGIYSKKSVEKIPYTLLKKYFLLGSGKNEGFFKVRKTLKDTVTFGRLNLNDDRYMIKNKIDIIFCRNVFIYFNKETQGEILSKFYNQLLTNGYLFLGHSESINLSISQEPWQSVFKTTYRK
ncbi:MAG: protein-glutamate O-methyltransferase CheR [Bacillota bacterium]|nr:protein-glutamate O-methyltransferase CheR [Bacillota bacterium]